MEALCVELTVLGIVVDEKNGSGVRHDNHLFREMAWMAPLPGPLSKESLAYAPTKAPVNPRISGSWSHFAAYVVQAFWPKRLIYYLMVIPQPMSLDQQPQPFDDWDWVYEIKHDGF